MVILTSGLAAAIAAVAAVVIMAVVLSYLLAPQSGGRPFSEIGQDIGEGVPGSYSNRPNPADPTKPILYPGLGLLPTYYGHGIPLETPAPGPLDPTVGPLSPHHLNPKCSPRCCPSPYSCDHGCLCVDTKGIADAAKYDLGHPVRLPWI